MRARYHGWLTVQETAGVLDSTSGEICRLLKLGRLTGTKQKNFRRTGKAQWLVNPKSISKEEKRRKANRAVMARRRERAATRA
jgi:hypothetical protein